MSGHLTEREKRIITRLDWLTLAKELYRCERQIEELKEAADEAYSALQDAENAVVQGDLPAGCPDIDSVEQHLNDLQADVDAAEHNLCEQQMTLSEIQADLVRLEKTGGAER